MKKKLFIRGILYHCLLSTVFLPHISGILGYIRIISLSYRQYSLACFKMAKTTGSDIDGETCTNESRQRRPVSRIRHRQLIAEPTVHWLIGGRKNRLTRSGSSTATVCHHHHHALLSGLKRGAAFITYMQTVAAGRIDRPTMYL